MSLYRSICWGMPNNTRTGLKISSNRSFGVMNPPQSPDFNIIEAVWDHLDREQNKRQPTSKKELWNVLQGSLENYSWRLLESLFKRVQTVLERKRVHATRWLSSLLQMYKLFFFFALYTLFPFIFTHFSMDKFSHTDPQKETSCSLEPWHVLSL